MAEDPWDAYFYPETINEMGLGTLRNRFELRDKDLLRFIEYSATAGRSEQLRAGEVTVPHTYDEAHVRAVHRHLFQDVYEWAGEFRTVDMMKGLKGSFARTEDGAREIPDALRQMTRSVGAVDWQHANRSQFSEGIAETFAWLNHAHPFREGNGRTTKEFLSNVAAQSPRFGLDFDRVSPDVWNRFSDRSRPDMGERTPHPEQMHQVFRRLTVDRPGSGPVDPVRSPLLDVSFPRLATDATQQTPARGQDSTGDRLLQSRNSDRGQDERGR